MCRRLDLALDSTKTKGKLSRPESRALIYAMETNEELMVARGTRQCLFPQ